MLFPFPSGATCREISSSVKAELEFEERNSVICFFLPVLYFIKIPFQKNENNFNINNIEFFQSDIEEFDCEINIDTIFQNPPFGSQKRAERGVDLKFVKKAHEISPDVLYSFHMASTEEFLINFYNDNNLEITHIFKYKFPIPKIYEFHTKEKSDVDVIVLRAIL